MITSNQLMKKIGRLVVLVMLFTSIVAFSQKEALAVPLKPILDHVVEPLLIDSTQAASSQDQEQEDEDDIEQTDSTQAPTQETAPTPVNSIPEQPTLNQTVPQPTCPPAYPPPTYPSAYPQPSIPAYPQPIIGQPTYPPAYPQPTYPPPQLPMNVTSVYTVPQAYPPMYSPTPISRTPVIINNF